MMTCSAFENRLTEILAGELAAAETRAAIDDLRRHAEACPDCAGAAAWIDLAARPVADRDPIPDPGEAYWAGFNASVTRRVRVVPDGVAPAWRRFTVAAALVLALASGWFLRGRLAPGGNGSSANADPQTSADWSRLEEVIREATPEELAAALRNLPGGLGEGFEATDWDVGGGGLGTDWMPDELDDIDRDELLEWLEQLELERRPSS